MWNGIPRALRGLKLGPLLDPLSLFLFPALPLPPYPSRRRRLKRLLFPL